MEYWKKTVYIFSVNLYLSV